MASEINKFNFRKEAQLCGIFAIMFLSGLFFHFMFAASKVSVGFVSYKRDPEVFVLWAGVWFLAIVGSLLFMHKEAKKRNQQKYVVLLRFILGVFVFVTGILSIRYF